MDVTIIGGGMITNDLILPAVYHLQRLGTVGQIAVCSLRSATLRTLATGEELNTAFPGQAFIPYPALDADPEQSFPELYRTALAALSPRQAVVVAVPDPLHYPIVMAALQHDQHVLCVKPLVLKYEHAREIEETAQARGLFVGVEYHKRFDRRALVARRHYRLGHFGEFRIGEARMIEPFYYRSSNFQNWFTADQTDPFVYVGCHYVDLVYFITGLRPVEVSVSGIRGRFPNGNEGFMWANGRVRYENGALLSVIDGLGYPDAAAGSNDQGLLMYCEGNDASGLIEHDDQYRGVRHSYLGGQEPGEARYRYVSPDFYRLVPWTGGPGAMPVGYGYDSIAAILNAISHIENATAGLVPEVALRRRQALSREYDEQGLIATPANSAINELVVEAGRLSILNDGAWAKIIYDPVPHVALR